MAMLEIVPSTIVEVSWNTTTYYMNIYTCVLDDIRRLTAYNIFSWISFFFQKVTILESFKIPIVIT